VELLNETDGHSLCALKSKEEFNSMVKKHQEKIKRLFDGYTPKVFRNTELIYSDKIGEMVSEMGYEGILTEGAKHILGWKSPNYVYLNSANPKLKVLLKNFQLSDDIAFRFSNKSWEDSPLTIEKFVKWVNHIPKEEEVLNLFMDYETFGEHQWAETGIFDFMRNLPDAIFHHTDFNFSTPSEVIRDAKAIAQIHVPTPISWADEERDLTAWLGNDLQDEAFDKLYELEEEVKKIDDPEIQRDWNYLQTSDHFYYMCTKFFSDGDIHAYFSPYETPYEAFINYMNVLSDFILRLKEKAKESAPKKIRK
jgi:alpha-amylase